MGKSGPLERAQLANQIQGFRIPDRSDAWENNKIWNVVRFSSWLLSWSPKSSTLSCKSHIDIHVCQQKHLKLFFSCIDSKFLLRSECSWYRWVRMQVQKSSFIQIVTSLCSFGFNVKLLFGHCAQIKFFCNLIAFFRYLNSDHTSNFSETPATLPHWQR